MSADGYIEVVGYIDIDDSAPSDAAYRYWCPDHAPARFQEPWRAIGADEAADSEATCVVCHKPLAPAPVETQEGDDDAR